MYICDFCGHESATINDLHPHLAGCDKVPKNESGRHKCSYCGMEFGQINEYYTHVEMCEKKDEMVRKWKT